MACGSTRCPKDFPVPSRQAFEIPAPFPGSGHFLARIVARLLWLYDRQRQRRALLELDARLLADIGITREQAEAEGNKPFWSVSDGVRDKWHV